MYEYFSIYLYTYILDIYIHTSSIIRRPILKTRRNDLTGAADVGLIASTSLWLQHTTAP